ncbi:hypothetical protein LMG19083_03644 [Ralstonia psammae]|uniref:HTH luxR-type domain-containing protein n=2 Tax=Ralstonia TaxID=48736 RepID=A0AAD2AW17_9RALS|nr:MULTISPECIES: helix-turn-helix transcriptional regulator [Ralstonia]CAJ0692761.1 hypothetical protein LMG18091_01667 [Ralstonia wenshanensis]CAJ0801856.1 hypothetical protein LMG19083_03644 [Ralstonia sp. LMG 19083]
MNARVQNDVLLQAADITPESTYFPPFHQVAARWSTQGGAPLTVATPRAVLASPGRVLIDLTELAEAAGEPPPPQPVTLEQAHAILGRMLAAQRQERALSSGDSPALSALTRRQRDILREAASGKSNVEIAQALHIGVETVKSHVRQILMRLQARNRTELAALYQQSVGEIRMPGNH